MDNVDALITYTPGFARDTRQVSDLIIVIPQPGQSMYSRQTSPRLLSLSILPVLN
jgi:hypothetical protein